jgi:hypothetical protein
MNEGKVCFCVIRAKRGRPVRSSPYLLHSPACASNVTPYSCMQSVHRAGSLYQDSNAVDTKVADLE